MRVPLVIACGLTLLVGAQSIRALPRDLRGKQQDVPPYAPSPETARLVSLGYYELGADLMFFRLVGYFAGKKTADGVAALVEAIVALDPLHPKAYEWGALAMAHEGTRDIRREHYLRAIRVLEIGMRHHPTSYRLPQLAGEIYLVDLKTKDPDERRRWNERGTELFEAAIRKPNAPASYATFAATLRTRLGQKQRAIDNLREMILITPDETARAELLEKLVELTKADSDEIASELLELRSRFHKEWKRERPFVPASLYVLLGPQMARGFDMTELAVGGREIVLDRERSEPQ